MKNRSWIMKPQTIADIIKDIGLIFFGTMVVGSFIGDNPSIVTIIFGCALSIGAWLITLSLSRN